MNIKIGDHVVRCDDGVDSATHSNYRRRGVYNNTIELINKISQGEKTDYRFAVSDNQIIVKNRPIHYQIFPFEVLHIYRIRDIDLHLSYATGWNDARVKYGFNFLKFINKFIMIIYFIQKVIKSIIKVFNLNNFIIMFFRICNKHILEFI